MELALTSILAFASTNIDDIFIMMIFFADKTYKAKDILIGQYLGIIALFVISLIGSLIGLLLDQRYIGLLGFLPVYFGIRGFSYLIKDHKKQGQKDVSVIPKKTNKTFAVAAVTFSNGGDNIGIYIPLLAAFSMSEKIIMFTIFLIMIAIWYIVARYLSKHPIIASTLDRFGHAITPTVLILLGIYILYRSGSFTLILHP